VTRVAVVGAGVMGCATAWALAERGAEVTLYEQHEPGNPRGSSHGRSRIVRYSYADPAWIELAREARAAWSELEAATGRKVLDLRGFVELARTTEQTSGAAMAVQGIEHRYLSPEEARRRGVVVPPGWVALFEPTGGIVLADVALSALLELAVARGARVEPGLRVSSLDDLDGDVVVVTAGAWVRDLVPDVPVRVTRETIVYFQYDGPPLPSLVELSERGIAHALYALHDPLHGLKAGAHQRGPEADPDDDGVPDPGLMAETAEWVRERLPDVDPIPVAAETCLYTTTADDSFVLERRGRVVVGSACSGHGFKFAPAVGRRLAELALA
jgi:sarcosine oxidase